MYQVRILDSAAHELAGLEKTIARNIVKRIHWLSENNDRGEILNVTHASQCG